MALGLKNVKGHSFSACALRNHYVVICSYVRKCAATKLDRTVHLTLKQA